MGLTVSLDDGRAACLASIDGFVSAVDALSEHELLAASRCHGWTRLDVVVHVIAGWQEMLGGLVCVVDDAPTVDAASYWPAFAEQYGGDDPVADLMAQRRRTAAYARPSSAVAQLHDVADALRHGVTGAGECRLRWQGHVFTAGDYLAVWAVEHVVHQLDLATVDPAPAEALALARTTVEALLGEPLPDTWDDAQVVLVGAGRVPAEAGSAVADRLPVLG